MDVESDPFRRLFQHLCRHLVCLIYKHEAKRPVDAEGRRVGFASGFIMEFQGAWFLATAGHFMQELEDLRRDRPDRKIEVTIADSFGEGVIDDTMIPLSYFDSPRHHAYDDEHGIDFGLIHLPDNTCDLLASNGRIPVIESHWRDWSDVKFASHSIFGVLAEGSHETPNNGMYLRTAQFDLSPFEKPPQQFARFVQPMRFFKITNLGDTKSIVGMSGCPIIGFRVNWEVEQMSYFFLGIQSGWLPDSKILYSCDLAYIAKDLIAGMVDAD